MDFKPKQISKFKNNTDVVYTTFDISKELEDDIFYIWNLKGIENTGSFKYLIIPDTCIDIILEESNGSFIQPIISQPFNKPIELEFKDSFNYWGIRFKPGKIMKYLWFNLNTIDVFKDINLKSNEFASIIEFLEKFLKFKPSQFDNTFLRFDYAPHKILESTLSEKQKSRLFEQLTGFKINTYKKIQKFHASLNDPYLHFYDQSHYIKTFKELTQEAPKTFSDKFSI